MQTPRSSSIEGRRTWRATMELPKEHLLSHVNINYSLVTEASAAIYIELSLSLTLSATKVGRRTRPGFGLAGNLGNILTPSCHTTQ